MDTYYVYKLPEAPLGHGYIICRALQLWECAREKASRDRCAAIPLIWEGEAADADEALARARESLSGLVLP